MGVQHSCNQCAAFGWRPRARPAAPHIQGVGLHSGSIQRSRIQPTGKTDLLFNNANGHKCAARTESLFARPWAGFYFSDLEKSRQARGPPTRQA